MVNVALIKGEDRKENILKALRLIRKDIKIGNKRLLIKPNFVSVKKQLAATHVDCIRGILEFFNEFYRKKVVIGESAFIYSGSTSKGYRNFGYYKLKDEYDIEFVDFNKEDYEEIFIKDRNNKPIKIRISKWLTDKENYVVSAAKLKTHDTVVATLSVKNILMGAPLNSIFRSDKFKVHQGYKQINLNLLEIAKHVRFDLGVIDGFRGMQGNGPGNGFPFESKVAIVSKDCVAADRVGVEIMGINASKVGYLNYMWKEGRGEYDLKKIKILGSKLSECRYKFKLHKTIEEQYKWQ